MSWSKLSAFLDHHWPECSHLHRTRPVTSPPMTVLPVAPSSSAASFSSCSGSSASQFIFHLREVSLHQPKSRTGRRAFLRDLWVFGRTPQGFSVALKVKGVEPWIDVNVDGWTDTQQEALEDFLRLPDKKGRDFPIASVRRERLVPFVGHSYNRPQTILRVRVPNPAYLRELKTRLSAGTMIPGLPGTTTPEFYHADWDLTDQFLMVAKLSLQTWVSVDVRALRTHRTNLTTSYYDGTLTWRERVMTPVPEHMIPVAHVTRCLNVRIRAISAATKANPDDIKIPDPDKKGDVVPMIATESHWLGLSHPNRRVLFYYRLNDQDLRLGVRLSPDDNETLLVPCTRMEDLYDCFARYAFEYMDADFLIHFDDSFQTLRHLGHAGGLNYTKMLNDGPSVYRNFYGTPRILRTGRCLFDVRDDLAKLYCKPGLDSYTLVAYNSREDITGRQPVAGFHEIDPYMATLHYFGKPEKIRRELLLELEMLTHCEAHRDVVLANLELSNTTSCDVYNCNSGGQQKKLYCGLKQEVYKEACFMNGEKLKESCLVVSKTVLNSFPTPDQSLPNIRPRERRLGLGPLPEEKKIRKTKKVFQGGYVHTPIAGFYEDWTGTLDFASLYPSIVVGYSVGYMTLVFPEPEPPGETGRQRKHRLAAQVQNLMDDPNIDLQAVPINGDDCVLFVRNGRSLVPKLMSKYLKGRYAKKDAMKAEKDPARRAVYNAQQLALKVLQNAFYGFFGARKGLFAYPVLMGVVCSIGRWMNLASKHLVLSQYPACVVYGDTDSIMVQSLLPTEYAEMFPDEADVKVQEAKRYFQLFKDMSDSITALFRPPNRMEFEGCKKNFLLYKAKMYAYAEWSPKDPYKDHGPHVSGLPHCKRDRCRLVSDLGTKLVRFVLYKHPVAEIRQAVQSTVERLLGGGVPLEELVITCSMKAMHEYKNQNILQIHTAKKQSALTGVPVFPGTRIAYVVRSPLRENEPYAVRGEPLVAMEKHPEYKIDYVYYLESQLQKPISMLLFTHKNRWDVDKYFAEQIQRAKNMRDGVRSIRDFFPASKRQRV